MRRPRGGTVSYDPAQPALGATHGQEIAHWQCHFDGVRVGPDERLPGDVLQRGAALLVAAWGVRDAAPLSTTTYVALAGVMAQTRALAEGCPWSESSFWDRDRRLTEPAR